VFGRDSLLQLYLEAYGAPGPTGVAIAVAADGGAPIYTDSVSLTGSGAVRSAIARLPVSKLGLGVVWLTLTPRPGGTALRLPAVIRLGDELAVASFDDMVQYLRFFASPERLRMLRDSAHGGKPSQWWAFVHETDSTPATEENEALRDYLRRVQAANAQFREDDVPGWLTDRGKAYTALGEPSRIAEPTGGDANGRGMSVVWEYREPHLQLVFIEQSGLGRWRMTPASQAEFESAFKRLTSCAGCR
jgi:GWxTD domain-containing protein